ncbi:MAG TPA: class I SAM-dependent methyltransferase [Actinocatenispora sp.]
MADIGKYYREGGERTRLLDGAGLLEGLRTRDVLARFLPAAPARVLDVGGATGVYAGWLADAGYDVHLVDLMPEHVAVAAGLPGVTAAVGDARALAEPAASADAVLLLGPLYHLLDRADRVAAWREAARTVRPGGPVIAATIGRFASLHDGFVQDFYADPRFLPIVERALATGEHRPEGDWFTDAYFHRPEEPAAEARDAGLDVVTVVAVEGTLWQLGPRLGEILADPARTELMLSMLRRIEAEPSLLGASSHLLTIATRPGA